MVVKDGIVVQSINFKKYLPVGKPPIAIEYLNRWGIDEIILLDISATRQQRQPDFQMIKKASVKCHVPLTVGGGITSVDHIKELMHCGADKISLNQQALTRHALIKDAALIFGDQCVVVSIDAVMTEKGYRVYDYMGKKPVDKSPAQFAKEAQDRGAGEILINSVDRDGSYSGFDMELINSVCSAVTIPVICCGGAKNADDFKEVFSKTHTSAAGAANFFHFTEHSVNITKAAVLASMPVRLDTHADYSCNSFDENFRLLKKTDAELEQLLFIRIEKEII